MHRAVRHLLVLSLTLAAFPAMATGPQLHLLTGVDAPDAVTVYAAPGGDAKVIGELAADGPPVAVLERNESGEWAHIGWRGGSAWVSARYLRPAFADGPEPFRVAGVPEGDVLNVRAEPSAGSADIGDIANGDPVEVLAAGPEAKWGRIVNGEGNGWISLRYVRPAAPQRVGESAIPVGLLCTGTEPFWSLRAAGPGTVIFSEPAAGAVEDRRAAIEWSGTASGFRAFPGALRARAGAKDYTLIVRPAACSDGMSDRDYGWSADALAGDRLLSGCCRWRPEEANEGAPE